MCIDEKFCTEGEGEDMSEHLVGHVCARREYVIKAKTPYTQYQKRCLACPGFDNECPDFSSGYIY